MARFLVLTTFTTPDAPLPHYASHRKYLDALADQGKLRTAGPFVDDTGGVIILEAEDEAEARALMATDPYATANVFANVDIRQFRIIAGN